MLRTPGRPLRDLVYQRSWIRSGVAGFTIGVPMSEHTARDQRSSLGAVDYTRLREAAAE